MLSPGNEGTIQLDAPLQDLVMIGDADIVPGTPSAQPANRDPTCYLPGAATEGGGIPSANPTHTVDLVPASTSDKTGNDEPDSARGQLTGEDARQSDEPTLEGVGRSVTNIEELGRGGMGVVYKARHRRLHRLAALKMVLAGAHVGKIGLAHSCRGGSDRSAHSNIVQIYETGEHDGHPYISLEFVEGGSLDRRMAR